jgi:hypothetical protein
MKMGMWAWCRVQEAGTCSTSWSDTHMGAPYSDCELLCPAAGSLVGSGRSCKPLHR